MKRTIQLIITVGLLLFVAACGDKTDEAEPEELLALDVDFIIDETADVGEEVELKAVVTYGDEKVTDASQMDFEVWERGKEDESETIEAENHEDGTYTIQYTFEDDGIYEMFAHTTAHEQHTMPKKEITIGEGGEYADEDEESNYHTEGFDMNFMDVDHAVAGEDTDLVVQLTLDDEPYEELDVRYEVVFHEEHDWIDAEEDATGEYTSSHTFDEAGTYEVIIHVEDDEDLHEHETVEVEVHE